MPQDPEDHVKVTFTQEEQERCRESFLYYDKDRSGTIDQYELRNALQTYGIKVTEEELFSMISEVDQNSNGVIDYSEYAEILLKAKEKQVAMGSTGDLSECTGV